MSLMVRIVADERDSLAQSVRTELRRKGRHVDWLSIRELVETTSIRQSGLEAEVVPDVPTLFRPSMSSLDDPESDEAFLQGEYWAAAVAISQMSRSPFIGRYGIRAEPMLQVPRAASIWAECTSVVSAPQPVARRQWLGTPSTLRELEATTMLLPFRQSVVSGSIRSRDEWPVEGEALRASEPSFLLGPFTTAYVGTVLDTPTSVYMTYTNADERQRKLLDGSLREAAARIADCMDMDLLSVRFAVDEGARHFTVLDMDAYPGAQPVRALCEEIAALCADRLSGSRASV